MTILQESTFTLTSGDVVLSRISQYDNENRPYSFSNRTQAIRAAERVGGAVIKRGRPWYVKVEKKP